MRTGSNKVGGQDEGENGNSCLVGNLDYLLGFVPAGIVIKIAEDSVNLSAGNGVQPLRLHHAKSVIERSRSRGPSFEDLSQPFVYFFQFVCWLNHGDRLIVKGNEESSISFVPNCSQKLTRQSCFVLDMSVGNSAPAYVKEEPDG